MWRYFSSTHFSGNFEQFEVDVHQYGEYKDNKIIKTSVREMIMSLIEIAFKVAWKMSNIARKVSNLRLVTDLRWKIG